VKEVIPMRYSLQKYEGRDEAGVEHWRIVMQNHDLKSLMDVCPRNFRIIDNETREVIWQP
jgi:hypothetical protein